MGPRCHRAKRFPPELTAAMMLSFSPLVRSSLDAFEPQPRKTAPALPQSNLARPPRPKSHRLLPDMHLQAFTVMAVFSYVPPSFHNPPQDMQTTARRGQVAPASQDMLEPS